MFDFMDWLCGNPDKYGFDASTGDYAPIYYVFGVLVGIPLVVLMIASVSAGVKQAIRAPYIRIYHRDEDVFDDYHYGDHNHRG